LGINGDLKAVLRQLLPRLKQLDHKAWIKQINDWREESDMRDIVKNALPDEKLWAPHVISDLYKFTGGKAIVCTDVGQHQMWEAQYYPHARPRTLITSGGLGTMGFGMPAAVGAKFGMPDEEVWAVVGDGGFQMTLCELGTARQENININIVIINNSYLGMVRQWQEFFYEERYIATPMMNPDFVKLAEAYAIPARLVTRREDIQAAVEWSRSINGPSLIEFQVEQHDIVYPMVPAGADLHAMIRRPTIKESQDWNNPDAV
jgi:acetolactate synthase-1/2/3 large subunit